MLSPFFKFYLTFFILIFYFIFPSILLTFSLFPSHILTLDFLSLLHLLYLPLLLTALWLLTYFTFFCLSDRSDKESFSQSLEESTFAKWILNFKDIFELQILKKLMHKNLFIPFPQNSVLIRQSLHATYIFYSVFL
jgi:hypothetical protein